MRIVRKEFAIEKETKLELKDRNLIVEKGDLIKVIRSELKEAKTQAFSDFDANFRSNFIGAGDLDRALDVVEESDISIGYGPDWLAERYVEYSEDGSTSLDKIDIVALVYEDILNDASGEIIEKTGIDIYSDLSDEIYVADNYLATSYDYRGDVGDQLELLFRENGVDKKSFSQTTQWFLNEVGVSL